MSEYLNFFMALPEKKTPHLVAYQLLLMVMVFLYIFMGSVIQVVRRLLPKIFVTTDGIPEIRTQ